MNIGEALFKIRRFLEEHQADEETMKAWEDLWAGLHKSSGGANEMKNERCFNTDGELYDESLTRKAQKDAMTIYEKIIKQINMVGFVTVLDVVCDICKFPAPKNWMYAATHGWTRKNVFHFTIRKTDDGRYGVYLGNPHRLLNDE